ncbi:hypothetical protein BN1864_LIB5394:05204 [Pseudomonas sp. 1 R 17]|nr:hypothetical protein BN1864_LIB5394:05204 [Pseudomonas sp. 1 R 17]
MKKNGFAHRIGYSLGRLLRGNTFREAILIDWLVAKGAPVVMARIMLWIVKILLLGALLYFVFWLALVFIAFLFFAVSLKSRFDAEDPVVGFDGEDLFPDHDSPEKSDDPKYD